MDLCFLEPPPAVDTPPIGATRDDLTSAPIAAVNGAAVADMRRPMLAVPTDSSLLPKFDIPSASDAAALFSAAFLFFCSCVIIVESFLILLSLLAICDEEDACPTIEVVVVGSIFFPCPVISLIKLSNSVVYI